MELARTFSGNYPFKANVPVYDAALLATDELVMRFATWHSGVSKFYITAYTASSAEAVDALGVLECGAVNAGDNKDNNTFYRIGTDDIPDAAISVGGNFLPCIINPDACYFAEYDQTDAIDQTGAVSASTTWAITSLEDNIDGGWLFTTKQKSSTATYSGLIRYATASAAGNITADSAVTVDTSTDVVKVLPIGHRLNGLNAEATGLTTTAAASSAVQLDLRENYIQWQGSPEMELRYWNHRGMSDLGGLRVRGEVILLDHCYRQVV